MHQQSSHISVGEMVRPVSALVFASMLGCVLLVLRLLLTGHFRHLFLVWNLFLAWLPLGFALVAVCLAQTQPQRRLSFFAACSAWLLFFPNAPYILTDLIHLGPKTQGRYWTDLVLILLFALIGLVLGFLSLFLMQRLIARRHGWPTGWLFVGGVAGLSGFGIYAGRFLRWNSWDVVFSPLDLLTEAGHWLFHTAYNPRGLLIPALFATMLFIVYLLLYSLTNLPNNLNPPTDTTNASRT